MLSKAKATKTLGWVELENKNLVEWDGRGMKIISAKYEELKFGIHVIDHKIYNSCHLNSVFCEAVDLVVKVVKNMETVRVCARSYDQLFFMTLNTKSTASHDTLFRWLEL